jgi:hypothetical protein
LPKIPVNQLVPGMKLTKPVLNESGMVLLSGDNELTEATIEKLRNMNVDGVFIKGLAKPEKPKEEALSELYKRFEKVEQEPYMDMLKRVLKEHVEGLYE